MTWLKGQTNWANFVDKMVSLACGESTDDSGASVAVGDRWVRMLAGENCIASPLSRAVDHTAQSWRAGYCRMPTGWGLSDVKQGFTIKQIGLGSGMPFARNHFQMYISGNGNVGGTAGVYNTFTVYAYVTDCDNPTVNYTSGGTTPNAAGVFTLLGVQWQIVSPTGWVPGTSSGLPYYSITRYVSTEYPGGVDFWPMLHRKHPGSNVTFGIAPAGVAGTDYDVVNAASVMSTPYPTGNYGVRGGHVRGLGIKTLAALNGARYTVTFKMARQTIWPYVYDGGRVGARWGCGVAPDTTVPATKRQTGGVDRGVWLQCFQTPSSVAPSSLVQYWMSVTADRIVVVANGDPGQTGKLGGAGLWELESDPAFASFDVMANAITPAPYQWITDQTASYVYVMVGEYRASWLRRYAQQYDTPAGRDWGLGWMRGDLIVDDAVGNSGNYTLYQDGGKVGFGVQDDHAPNFETKPAPIDDKWRLYGWSYVDSQMTYSSGGADENALHRGTFDKILYLPGLSWGSGDELVDTVSGDTYFLVMCDYGAGPFSRTRFSSNAYAGGAAILEA